MIHSGIRNSVVSIYGWIQLSASCHLLILGWSNLVKYQGWSLSVVPVSWFVTKKEIKNISRRKRHPINVLYWRLKDFVAAVATVYQEPHFWRTEGQELFAFLFDWKKTTIYRVWIPCNGWSNPIQGILFLEFMGESNLTLASFPGSCATHARAWGRG